MRDEIVKINKKHRDKFITFIDKMDSNKKFKYTMTEKMNGDVSINFVDDIDKMIEELPGDSEFLFRIKKLIKAVKIQSPRKIIIKFI